MKHTTNAKLSVQDIRNITQLTYQSIAEYEEVASHLIKRAADTQRAREIFRKVWELPSTVEGKPYDMLTQGERRQQTLAYAARDKAMAIYQDSPTQETSRVLTSVSGKQSLSMQTITLRVAPNGSPLPPSVDAMTQ